MVLRNVSNKSLQKQGSSSDIVKEDSTKDNLTNQSSTNNNVNRYVQASVASFYRDSSLSFESVPSVHSHEVKQGKVLGSGGFAIVHECDYQNLSLAKKSLKPSLQSDFGVAASDLWKEALLMSSLDHPNICKIHAHRLDASDLSHNFLVLDRLVETLPQRMEESWKESVRHNGGEGKKRTLLRQRLQIGLGIAKALQYLHSEKKVIYRDLKADNVGFDSDGTVKLFDFGLAKELKDSDEATNGKYRLSGDTGSYAYMAPEVAKGWKYDSSVDIYSFGILLWELASFQYAYADHESKSDFRRVWSGDEVLTMIEWWPVELQWILKKCTSLFSKSRPTWDCIIETLEEIIEDADQEEEMTRGIKSFRFGSRRSQRLEDDSSERAFSTQRGKNALQQQQQQRPVRQKLFGIF